MPETLGPFNLILLAIPGIGLRLALRILYSTRSRVASDPLRSVLSLASTLMIILAICGALIALTGPAIVPLGIVGIVAALMVHDRLRRAEHRALLWSLAVAAQKGIPLSEAARAYADESEGDTGYRATRLAQAVEAGEPLSGAVRHARLRMAPAMRLALGLGERLGMLGPAMKQQLDDTQQADAALGGAIARFVQLGVVLLALVNITAFVMLKIVPVFEKMFQEFEIELPSSTKLVINLSVLTVNYWFLIPLAISIPLALGSIFVIVMYLLENLHTDYSNRPVERFLLRPRRIVRIILALLASICLAPFCVWPLTAVLFLLPAFFVVLYFIGFFPRDLPVVWRLFRRYDGALVMRGLAVAVRRGLPLLPAIDAVRLSYPLRHVAALLGRVMDRISGGADWIESLRQAKLISRADAAVLAAAERAGNLPWALEEMADSVIRRQTYRLQVAMNVIFPPALLAVAALVGLFAVGLFQPIVTLIQDLTMRT